MSTEEKKPFPQQLPLEKPHVNIEREIPNLNEQINPDASIQKWTTVDTVSDSTIKKGANSWSGTKANPKED